MSGLAKIFWRHPGHLFWILVAYLPMLWNLSVPLTGDQKTYIAVAMEMRERGEWLRPFLFGETNYLKPPFQYWMSLIGWNVAGFNLVGTLLPSVLALLATAWFLSEIASLLGERRWYVNAGLWFAATIGAMTYGTTAQMEIYLCLFYTAAWWAGLHYLVPEAGSRNPRWLYAAFLIAGLSAWVKSPLYSVFWVVGYVSYLLVSGEWLLFKAKHLYYALVAGIVVGLSWFIAIYCVDHDRFWSQYVEQEQLAKQGGNGGTPFKLWTALLYMSFPFTLLTFTALRAVWKGRRTTAIFRFVVAWCWPPALFFTLYPYRVNTYLFLLVPALAVAVDWGCFRVNRTRTFRWTARATGILMLIGMSVASFILYRAELIPAWLTLALVFCGIAAAVVAWAGWIRVFALCSLAAVLFFRIGAVELGRLDFDGLKEALGPVVPAEIGMLDDSRNIWHEVGLLSVGLGQPMLRLYQLDPMVSLLDRGGTLILSDEQNENYRNTLMQFLSSRGKTLEATPWRRFKGKKKFPYRELILYGREGVPDFDEMMTREFWVIKAVPTNSAVASGE